MFFINRYIIITLVNQTRDSGKGLIDGLGGVSGPIIIASFSVHEIGLGDFAFFEWISCVTTIPGPCNDSSISSPPLSKLPPPY